MEHLVTKVSIGCVIETKQELFYINIECIYLKGNRNLLYWCRSLYISEMKWQLFHINIETYLRLTNNKTWNSP